MTKLKFDYSDLRAYAGHLIDREQLLKSSSGGAASYIAEKFIDDGGIVFGVGYSDDFKSAEYYCVKTRDGLEILKGSKYIPSIKKIKIDGEYCSVFKTLEKYLLAGEKILYIGLGCDVAALKKYCIANGIDSTNLFTLELICVGTTMQEAHSMFIQEVERKYNAKVRKLNVRYKKEKWNLPYLRVEFDNENIFEAPFCESDLGIAFDILYQESCSRCKYKGSQHVGDIAVGDYFRLEHDDEIYDENGVSILIKKTQKGEQLIESIESKEFILKEVDIEKALLDNHRYYECSEINDETKNVLVNLRKNGLRYAIEQHYEYLIPESIKYGPKKRVIMWGTGTFFERYCSLVDSLCNVQNVCDNDETKWGKVFQHNILCVSPQELSLKENIFVVIMIGDISIRKIVEKQLEALGVCGFDYVLNWIKYASRDLFY